MERARALPSRAQSCRSSFPFVSERASFAAGFAQQRKKILRITSRSPQQDGSYLSELLLDKGYVVHGLKRRASSYNHPRIEHIMDSSEFFFFLFCFLRGRGSNDSSLWLIFENCNNSKTGYPGSERFFLHYADLIDFGSLCQLLR